ncbi:MAG: BtpA/SgcQ family protein, partial [Sphaerochaetaceae bacterium]
MNSQFSTVFNHKKPIIGMVHVKALPGTPLYDRTGGMQHIIDAALRDVEILDAAGIDGIQLENQWDRPFMREAELGPETVSCLTYIVALAQRATKL